MTWHMMSITEVCEKLKVNEKSGLSESEAEQRLKIYGENKLTEQKKSGFFKRFLAQLCDFMVVILLIAAAISFVISFLGAEGDYFDPIVILAIVIINATVGVIQEYRAEKALDSLKQLTSPTVTVKRNGKMRSIASNLVVPGDIIFLRTGDIVPADARLLDSVLLKADESALTGESHPSDKTHDVSYHSPLSAGDIHNMVFSTTSITSGYCTAVVVETGMDTQVGKIAELLIQSDSPHTPLQEKLAKTGKTLGSAALFVCGIIFLMGILRQMPPFEMFMTSVSLAVAAIPEGLPAIVTVMLALGVSRMAKKRAIVRKLPAVETLGSANIICSDKTGTLTQNKMTVVDIYGDKEIALNLCVLCNNNQDPTENALFNAATQYGILPEKLRQTYPRIREIPFDSRRKLMTTIHKDGMAFQAITKGAPDILIDKCKLSSEKKAQILKENERMAQKALRVIAVAYRNLNSPSETNVESNLTFVGLLGMIDPPRPEVKDAVKLCKKAGIKPVMITGDHVQTAKAIASEIGIYTPSTRAITGAELNTLSDENLKERILDISVFARVTPEHKVRIVRAYQSLGMVVAMTGDGINDAPALKTADIGCAMGLTGTDVAKEASDMILTDDNFATIVEAVREGRSIYSNIRKAVHFLLSCNIGEILTIFAAILFGFSAPLLAIHLLWVNLVTDSLPAIALGLERPDEDIMKRKPIDRSHNLFSQGLALDILVEGFLIGALSLLAYGIGLNIYEETVVARTMCFAVLGLSQLVHAYNMRSRGSVLKHFFSNRYLNFSFLICAAMQILVIATPALAPIFKVSPLDFSAWITVAILSVAPLVIIEIEKFIKKKIKVASFFSKKKHKLQAPTPIEPS